jgi:hypothetical protein
MADGNGRILALGRSPKKDNDFCTVAQARQIAADEATKVHEFYMNQIPAFTARMIQDALLGYGLIQVTPDAQLAATEAAPTPAPETGGSLAGESAGQQTSVGGEPPPMESTAP